MKRLVPMLLLGGMTFHCPPLFGQGDLCTGATAIACGAVAIGNTTLYTADVAPICGTTDGTGGGVWYRFIGSGVNTTASLCGSGYDTKIRVYSGTCAALVCTVGIDDFCGLQSQVTWFATTGVTYYILVHGFGAAAGAYTLAITCAAAPVPMCYSEVSVPYAADTYAGTALTLSDDIHSSVVNIGFPFCYNGTTYTQCVISSNNYVTFNLAMAGTYSPWVTVAIPNVTPNQPHNAVLNPWQDIHPGVGGQIRYQTLGTAPNRRFVVSYLNVPMFSCTSQLYTSQTVLYESSNCIGSHILTKPVCATWNSGNAVHGLQNNGGTSAVVVPGRNNTQWTATAQGRLFTPTCVPCSTATTTQCLSVILPIELLEFHGRNDGSQNILEWATASEQNSDRFIVERSADGSVFEEIHSMDGAGTSNALINYQANDLAPLHGVNYYRLRQTDLDGGETLSDVIAVTAQGNVVLLFPNPATSLTTYLLPISTPLPTTLFVRDLAGRVTMRSDVFDRQGTLDIGGLVAGTYLIDLQGHGSAVRFVIE